MYRAVDEHGQVIDVAVSLCRDMAAARSLFAAVRSRTVHPDEVVADRSAALAHVIADLLPDAVNGTDQYANNRVECDQSRPKAWLGPTRGLNTAGVIVRGHVFIENLRRGHCELGVEARHSQFGFAAAFAVLASTT